MKHGTRKKIAKLFGDLDPSFFTKVLQGKKKFPANRAGEGERLYGLNKEILTSKNPKKIEQELTRVFSWVKRESRTKTKTRKSAQVNP